MKRHKLSREKGTSDSHPLEYKSKYNYKSFLHEINRGAEMFSLIGFHKLWRLIVYLSLLDACR